MAPNLVVIVPAFERWCKTRQPTCPQCGWAGPCPKHGGYWRYAADGDARVRVQRHLCRNIKCTAVTFSLLRTGWLPLFRISMVWLGLLLMMAEIYSVSTLAALFDCARATVRRRIAKARCFFAWLAEELSIIEMATNWGSFCQLVLRAKFPTHPAM